MLVFYRLFLLFLLSVSMYACNMHAQDITLVDNNSSDYSIIIPAKFTPLEQQSASVLQKYIKQITGYEMPILKEGKGKLVTGIYLGQTVLGYKINSTKLTAEAYLIETDSKYVVIRGGSGKGLIFGVYSLLENYFGCKKIAGEPAIVPVKKTLSIKSKISEQQDAPFEYREVYYPASHDGEYVTWNKLHKFEDLWGLWGHSFNKLVPAKKWFGNHPEFYALVKDVRQPSQLCLSNEEVFKIVVADLKSRMDDNPEAMYWSISPNDDLGYCECEKCKTIDDKEGGPQGSLINFVNRVAKEFRGKKFTTLAYSYTHRAPKTIKPADNVYIFLSDIDAYRDKPLAEEGTAAGFRNDLKAWKAMTPNIFVWDYITQFTNYLAPFPNFQTLQANIGFFKDNGVKGIFAQGSGDTYSEWAELRSYLVAKLMWNTKADVQKLSYQFLKDYYGNDAAIYLRQYIDLVQVKMKESKHKLDIYGNPVNEYLSWLSPELIEQYSDFFDKAEAAAERNALFLERVVRCRLAIEYTVFQQARFYGIEKHGIFIKDDNGQWGLKPKLKEKLVAFVANCKKAGVTEMSEGGISPEQYLAEWDTIIKQGVTPTKAIGATVTLQFPFANDYPAKGNRTLIDGNPGYLDFSYNWLCFYDVPMVATIDLGKPVLISQIKMHFLDDPRHWIFLPAGIEVEVSKNGSDFTKVADQIATPLEEHYEKSIKEYTLPFKQKKPGSYRYIKVTAKNLPTLPLWRSRDNKKPMIACDEIFVQ